MVHVVNSPPQSPEVFAGIDWGGTFHQLCLLDAAGTVLLQQRVTHDVPGLHHLRQLLAGQQGRIRVAIERAEGVLVEQLQDAGLELFCVSPKISARARERYRLAATKSDAFDAFVLADTLRHEHGHWRPLAVASPLAAQIEASPVQWTQVMTARFFGSFTDGRDTP